MALVEDIKRIEEQEQQLRFAKFDESDGWKLGVQMHDAASKRNLPLVIDIRIGSRQLFYAALPGTAPDNAEWVRRKVNSVLRFQKSTYRMNREGELKKSPFDATRGIDVADFANAGGGFPIHIKGTGIVGAITVSGIPQRDDHGFVVGEVAAFLGLDPKKFALGPETE